MKKVIDFFKANPIIVKWTIWYFFILWFILRFVFGFDALSAHYWWRFFHATFHGFYGFVFASLTYMAIPIFIITSIITYRKKELLIPIPFESTISKILSKIFPKKSEPVKEEPAETKTEEQETHKTTSDLPSDIPPELRVPYTRVKNRMSLSGAISVYNKPTQQSAPITANAETDSSVPEIPIPMDFDVSDTIDNSLNDSVPTFTDLNFDTPIMTEQELENETTKYLKSKNIEYETYHDFVATEKFVIYEHSDKDFWIMEDDSWFAAGKQKDSPIRELIELSKQNDLTPVIYLASENIMDLDNIIAKFEKSGIRVVKSLSELY